MDIIQEGVLQGTLQASLNGGAQLVAGRHGNALYTDHAGSFNFAHFVLDANNKCLQNPAWCSSGVTFPMWLMNLPGNPGGYFTIFNTFGCDRRGIGFCAGIDSIFWLKFSDNFQQYRYRAPAFDVGKWQHIVFTFKLNDGIKLYVNGCDSIAYRLQEGYQLVSGHNPNQSFIGADFRLGGGRWSQLSGSHATHMKLDQLLIWYDVLNVTEVGHLYLNGGKFWKRTIAYGVVKWMLLYLLCTPPKIETLDVRTLSCTCCYKRTDAEQLLKLSNTYIRCHQIIGSHIWVHRAKHRSTSLSRIHMSFSNPSDVMDDVIPGPNRMGACHMPFLLSSFRII